MKHIRFYSIAFLTLNCLVLSASAQLSFTSGVNPMAGANGDYAAVQFWNFSNAGGSGGFSSGTGNNLYGTDPQSWTQQTYGIQFTYAPSAGEAVAKVSASSIGASIIISSVAPTELQILVGNTGLGNLTLTLTSINSVLYGGTLNGPHPFVFGGNPPTFTSDSTWSAANGATLQAYLDNPTLFSSAFTLNGTITLDAPANSANYGDNLNSLIQFNLTSVPEPSTGILFGIGLCALALVRLKRA
jgi:hypothetical protein